MVLYRSPEHNGTGVRSGKKEDHKRRTRNRKTPQRVNRPSLKAVVTQWGEVKKVLQSERRKEALNKLFLPQLPVWNNAWKVAQGAAQPYPFLAAPWATPLVPPVQFLRALHRNTSKPFNSSHQVQTHKS